MGGNLNHKNDERSVPEVPEVPHLLGELIKLAVVDLHLLRSPGWARGGVLEAPVGGEDVIEKVETVTSDIHLIDLHPKQGCDYVRPNTNQLPGYFLSFRTR